MRHRWVRNLPKVTQLFCGRTEMQTLGTLTRVITVDMSLLELVRQDGN